MPFFIFKFKSMFDKLLKYFCTSSIKRSKGYCNIGRLNVAVNKLKKYQKKVKGVKNRSDVKIIYNIQPYEYYIEQNVDYLIGLVKKCFYDNDYSIKIGVEIEFYLTKSKAMEENFFYDRVINFTEANNIDILGIEKERGIGQFEIQLKPYGDIDKLVTDYNKLKSFLIDDFNANFDDMPFMNDAGSSLQINISLFDKNNNNLFAKDGDCESDILRSAVAGLMKTTNMFLSFYLAKNKSMIRYNRIINNNLYNSGKIPAPTCINWGINNRTCSIRIPVAKNFGDVDKYISESKNNRRIEFRVPSSDSDIKLVLYCVLNSIMFGIKNNLVPMEPTYNNALLDHDKYEKIQIKQYKFSSYYKILKTILN